MASDGAQERAMGDGQRGLRRAWPLAVGLLLAGCGTGLLTSCGGGGNEAPERVDEPTEIPSFESRVVLPLSVPMAELQRIVNEEVPQQLASIERERDVCAPPTRVRVLKRDLKVTPTIRCRIVGEITRGPITLSGRGNSIRLSMPVNATVSARDIGRVIRGTTATAAAEVRADVRLSFTPDWQPVARITIDYDWTKEPGINLLMFRIRFASRADPEVEKIIADLERKLPGRLRELGLDKQVADVWAKGFTSVDVNRENPRVWLRITPKRLGFGGFSIENRQLVARVGLDAYTETFLGPRPPDPEVTPLPPMQSLETAHSGIRFAAPVVADFSELVPVLEDELDKISAQPIDVPLAGPTKVRFGTPIVYTTTGNRLAIGLPMQVKASRQIFSARGTVWLTGKPVNAPNSRKVVIEDLGIAGDASTVTGNILLMAAQSPAVLASIQSVLSQDFEGDFQELIGKINLALSALPIGDFVARAEVAGVNNGVVKPVGQGLFMPVEAYGAATVQFDPARADAIRAEKARARAEREARREARRQAKEAALKAIAPPAAPPAAAPAAPAAPATPATP